MNEDLFRVQRLLGLLQRQATNLERAYRFGSKNDGGYVLINDFNRGDYLISMGIAGDVNFELDVSQFVAGSHLYDDSIEDLPTDIRYGKFFKERIGGAGNTTIAKAMNRIDPKYDIVLKMDIEGSEWEALDSLTTKELIKFRQIVVEFHWLENIRNDKNYLQIISVLEKLAEGHFILNLHPNNNGDIFHIENISIPSVIEVTYLRKNDYQKIDFQSSYWDNLQELNSPCNPNLPDIYMPEIGNPSKLDYFTMSVGTYSKFHFEEVIRERDMAIRERDTVINSKIWKLTTPYRYVRRKFSSKFSI